MTEEIKKLIEEEAERTSCFKNKNELKDYNTKTLRLVDIRTFQSGADFILSKQPEMLRSFFIWFRKNGLKYIDLSIEKMIDIYLNENNNG